MAYTIRPIETDEHNRVSPADYALISPWWEARDALPPVREILPGLGAVCLRNNEPIAAAFLYLDACNSGVGWLGWLATRPATNSHHTGRAILHILRFLSAEARALNYWCLFASYSHPSLVSMLKRLGFQTADTGMTHLYQAI